VHPQDGNEKTYRPRRFIVAVTLTLFLHVEEPSFRKSAARKSRAGQRTLDFERQNGFVNVVVDEPQHIANTIPSVWEVTNPELAVVRLHGRNHGTWNRKGLKASSQRFDYDYRDDELEEIAGEVLKLAPRTTTTRVLFNNNYQDQGQRGAAALGRLLQSPLPSAG
jgi:uncharacterized protein YecE (DUF72 family)